MVADLIGHVRRERLLAPGDRVVVGCSGGSDSIALALLVARAAKRLRLAKVTIGHLDHGLRAGSKDDAAFVAAFAARIGVAAVAERHPVKRRRGESPEAAARRVRYRYLERVARSTGSNVILTAHHMDDQAETVLLRILRGTGLGGLRGIVPSRPVRRGSPIRLVRPLLPFRRERLREWLTRWKETWREDPTNVAGNVRARLRHKAIPALRECSGRDPVPLLARLADRAAHLQRKRPSADVSAKGRST
jgi:tRNA(Ile)-lysidine synthase